MLSKDISVVYTVPDICCYSSPSPVIVSHRDFVTLDVRQVNEDGWVHIWHYIVDCANSLTIM